MRTMLLITLMLAMPAAATAQDAGDADQADQRANEGASDYEAAWTVDPAAELDEETRRRRGEALERAALEFVGVTEPPSRTELLDLEQTPPHLRPQLRLGHVLQHEFGLQRPAELAVGGVEAVRGLEAVEPLQGGGRGGVPGGERRVELADTVPLLGDEAEVYRPTAALEDRFEDAVVAGRVGAVDPLAVETAMRRRAGT